MITPTRFKRRKTSCSRLSKAQTLFQLILLSLNAFCMRQRDRTSRISIRSLLSGTALALPSEITSPSSLTFPANILTLSRLSNSLLLAPMLLTPLATALTLKETLWPPLLARSLAPLPLDPLALRHHTVLVQSPQHAVNNTGLKVAVSAVVPMTTGFIHVRCHHIRQAGARSLIHQMTSLMVKVLHHH